MRQLMAVDKRRVRILRDGEVGAGPVVYIMGRDFRAGDNWALLYAQEQALKNRVPLCVLVHMGQNQLKTTARQHDFFIRGLQETATELERHHIPFFITFGDWKKEVKDFVNVHEIGLIVTDFSPLHELRYWWDDVSHGVKVPIHEVDAHNIIPCWLASSKQEFAAYTFRPKVKRLYPEFSGNIPKLKSHPFAWGVSKTACWPRGVDQHGCALIDWDGVAKMRSFEAEVEPVNTFTPGEIAAHKVLESFIKSRLKEYALKRNNPLEKQLSDLSPYIRFGQISCQRIAYEVSKVRRDYKSKDAFLEELVVRKELSENFCFYNDDYDNFAGLPDWAKQSLKKHTKDKRDYIYKTEQFEQAKTHNELWNAAQLELRKTGKMHSYMRMYWAKKILEWTNNPDEAIAIALMLNDRYELDGRCPNGYVGVLWSIGGLHDRAWGERPVFGKVRYMNETGCKRKFDVKGYIKQFKTEKVVTSN